MNKDKIKTKEVWSANGWYLFLGIVSVLIICMLEGCAIREFFVSSFEDAIVSAFFIQLPCLMCLLFTTLIGCWMRRKKFTLYYCKLEKGIDIEYIKDNYSVKDINSNGVLFVDKDHSYDFVVWRLLQGYRSLDEAEVKLFYK